MENLIQNLLSELGEDYNRPGLKQTPARVARSFKELTSGYALDPQSILREAQFAHTGHGLVVVRNIQFFSLCEHHLLPFFGTCHIAYQPNGAIVGLSKLARLVDCFARRLQVQERLTEQVAQALFENLKPLGVGLMMEAQHLCMMMRGVEQQACRVSSSCMLGSLKEDNGLRQEFLAQIKL